MKSIIFEKCIKKKRLNLPDAASKGKYRSYLWKTKLDKKDNTVIVIFTIWYFCFNYHLAPRRIFCIDAFVEF